MGTERRAIEVRGVVQGVGFRPFVYGLASSLGLRGFVTNQTSGVLIEIEGEPQVLDRFLSELSDRPPPLARIDRIRCEPRTPVGETFFRIQPSQTGGTSAVFVSPDFATCRACLSELFDPDDRRFRYPFLNCTHCGPRLTIVRGSPYDRVRTTMAGFPLCETCQAEYDDPANRRFHAQPIACARCGPKLRLQGAAGTISADDPLGTFVEAIQAGRIGAMKGLGGYHLVCLASSEEAVHRLRHRKHRDEKPFAVMVPDLAGARALGAVNPQEAALLESPRSPIVLLRRHDRPGLLATGIAPGNPCLGVFLPYTPLHHLLLRAVGVPLVMTSGNRADEPIAYEDDDAFARLVEIADLFLTHDRPIHVRCDDSVTRIVDEEELPIRRSRGYAPQPLPLPFELNQPVLAVGGQLKGTFALGRERQAFLSHHLGDLDHLDAYRAFVRDIRLFEELFDVRPQWIVHDLHPDYASTRYALDRSASAGMAALAVQHHHAHLASCMAEHGLTEPVIGVIFDGSGYGPDGTIWGGEFLIGDYRSYRRAAHWRPIRMPGGDQAIREPWRLAQASLLDAFPDPTTRPALPTLSGVPAPATRLIRSLLERGFQAPWTTSTGRLFDAVAALIGLRARVSYEGQAAIELEWLASELEPEEPYPFELVSPQKAPADPLVIDTRPLICRLVDDLRRGVTPRRMSRRFHDTIVEVVATVCDRLRQETGRDGVVLSGGVFQNALLTREVVQRLQREDFRVYRHRLVPPNDGGLSLGQVAVAAASGDPRKGDGTDVPGNPWTGG